MEVLDTNRMRRIAATFGLLLLAIGRTLFYSMFAMWSLLMIFGIWTSAHELIQTQFARSVRNVGAPAAILSLVWGFASWVIFRNVPRSKSWAVVANLTVLLAWFPAAYWGWKEFLIVENHLWTTALNQIFGMIVFSIPDGALRRRAYPAEVGNADGLCMSPLQEFMTDKQPLDSQNPRGETSQKPEADKSRSVAARFESELLPTCRTLYCSMFFFMSLLMIYNVYTNIQDIVRSHTSVNGNLIAILTMGAYALVFDIVWWMSFRNKAMLKSWAIAANLILIFAWAPVLAAGSWRSFLRAESDWWPVIAIGIIGIIIFSIPYRGWPHRPQMPAVGT